MVALPSAAPILATALPLIGLAMAEGLADIDHVVLFMQGTARRQAGIFNVIIDPGAENRAFDHYFGTMAGIRGFADPNLQYNGKVPVWQQVTDDLTNVTERMSPWYINYLGGDWPEASQCMTAGDNGWSSNHLAFNGGTNDHWAVNNTPYSIGYYKREDIPIHFSLAEEWVVGDMYQVINPIMFYFELTLNRNAFRNPLLLQPTPTVSHGCLAPSMYPALRKLKTMVATRTLTTTRHQGAMMMVSIAIL